MLGFDCYAEVSLATKMASTPQQVLDFLGELAAKAQALRGTRSCGTTRIRRR